MELLTQIKEKYDYAMTDLRDTRTDDWLLMSSIWPTVAAVIVYLFVVTYGQRLMSNRPPFQLKNLLVIYNFLLVVLSAYLFYEFVMSAWLRPGFNLACEPVDYSNDPVSLRLANVCWWFYFSKIIELLDTVFFVLRKKENQISFLHVYHHSSMPILWWVGVKYVAGGNSYFSATINSLVHTLMYLYYLLSSMGPSMRKYLWWKKYMTSFQLMQFFTITVHSIGSIYLDCGYPLGYNIGFIFYMVSQFILFSNFYYHAYINKPLKPKPMENGKAKTKHPNGFINGKVYNSVKRRRD